MFNILSGKTMKNSPAATSDAPRVPVNDTPRLPNAELGEERLPVAVLIDVSGSMKGCEDAIQDAIQQTLQAIRDDDTARVACEICVILFSGEEAQVVIPFGPVDNVNAPEIVCDGATPMHAAMRRALMEIDARLELYRGWNIPHKKAPWIFLISDGQPNDADDGSFEESRKRQSNRKLLLYPIAIGNEADKALLRGLSTAGILVSANKAAIREVFKFISLSVQAGSKAPDGSTIAAPQVEGVRMDQIQLP